MANSANSLFQILPMMLVFTGILAFLLNGQKHRLKCALAVFTPTVIHFVFLDDLGGESYYLSAMAFNAISISLLEFVRRGTATHLITDLQIISMVFMACNFVGYIVWYFYYPPTLYNIAIYAIALIEAVRLLIHTKGDRVDGIDGRVNHRRSNDSERGLGSRS